MAVRVVIEREIDQGQEMKLREALVQLRSHAIKAKGYISGETLRAVDNPQKYLVLSNWNTVEDWKVWQKNPERAKIQAELNKLLIKPETCTVYGHL
ncbi:MAG: antibiotic biosynthesis monooxygenase family protein [Syntrophobacteraceae bacterium]|nr:antibiotic biosynthesis monooxygenase [Desulfobacteraceae bacterium]